eukprot:4100301-Prymnesium_polylepis.2
MEQQLYGWGSLALAVAIALDIDAHRERGGPPVASRGSVITAVDPHARHTPPLVECTRGPHSTTMCGPCLGTLRMSRCMPAGARKGGWWRRRFKGLGRLREGFRHG